ncbi:MAG TPA: hypothetical protein EYP33_07305 [Pyrodictium sp.]|nr:hypothetical protein [Pyrodictium sp.]
MTKSKRRLPIKELKKMKFIKESVDSKRFHLIPKLNKEGSIESVDIYSAGSGFLIFTAVFKKDSTVAEIDESLKAL